MEAKEIVAIVDSMCEDELDVLSQPLALSEPERPDAMILRENGLPFCPGCGRVLSKRLLGYVDRFLFQKALSYAKEALDRPGAELSRLLKAKR